MGAIWRKNYIPLVKGPREICLRWPGVASFFISLFLYSPVLWIYSKTVPGEHRFGLMMSQAENPFSVIYDTIDNVLAYRIIVPLFNHFLGLRGLWIVLPSVIGALALCVMIAQIFRSRSDATTTFLSTLAFSLSFLVVSGTTFWPGTDSLAFFMVLLVMFLRRLDARSILVFLAISIDERSLVALLMLPFLSSIYKNTELPSLRYSIGEYASYVPGMILALFLRLLIGSGSIFPAPIEHIQYSNIVRGLSTGASFDIINILYNYLSWLLAFRWIWLYFVVILVIVFFESCIKENYFPSWNLTPYASAKSKIAMIPYVLVLILYFFMTLAAGDQWRCALYVFPFILGSALYLLQLDPVKYRWLTACIVGGMILTPQVSLGSLAGTLVSLQFTYPLPFVLVRTAKEFWP